MLDFFFGLIPIFLIIPKEHIKNFYKTKRIGLHVFRALSGSVAAISLFIALRQLPLADVVAITFAGPVFVTVLSIVILKEKVGLKRWSAVLLGFIGMAIIVQPGLSSLNLFYILPIIFCLGFSFVAIAIRKLSTTEPNYLIAFYFTFLGCLIGIATLPFGWVMPTFLDFILLIITGLFAGIANLLLTHSYRLSETSLVTPIKYLSLVFAIVFGYIIWKEIPTLVTLSGALLVILSSLIIFRREEKLKKQIIIPRT